MDEGFDFTVLSEWRQRLIKDHKTAEFGLRRCRYIGLAKTPLQNIAIACAINLTRVIAWFEGIPQESTRISRFASLQSFEEVL